MLMVLVLCPGCLGWLGGLGSFEFVGKCSGCNTLSRESLQYMIL